MAKKKFTDSISHTDAKYLPKGIKLSKKTAVLDNPDAFERNVDYDNDRAPIDQKAKKLNKSYKSAAEKYGITYGEPISGDDIAKMGKKRIDSSSLNRDSVDLTVKGLDAPKDRGSNPARRSGV